MEPKNEKEMSQNMKTVTSLPLHYIKKYLQTSVETNKNKRVRFKICFLYYLFIISQNNIKKVQEQHAFKFCYFQNLYINNFFFFANKEIVLGCFLL